MAARAVVMVVVLLLRECAGLGEVRTLDESNFDAVVNGAANVLVEFHEPECAHCERMEPEFYATAHALEFEEEVILGRVDTKESPKLKKRFGIEGHPVFKWFAKGSTEADKFYYVHYSGRMANTFLKMIGERMGREFETLPAIVSLVKKIKAEDFDSTVLVPAPVLVALYTPWNELKSVADALDETAKLFAGTVVVAKLGIERVFERDIADRYSCKHYPCYFLFDRDNRKHDLPGPYDDVQAYARFLNAKLGSDLDPAMLDERAMMGRLWDLDKLVAATPSHTLASVLEAAPVDDAAAAESKAYYVKLARRVDAEGPRFLPTESDRLAALLNKPGISPTKRREVAARKNIINAFIHALPAASSRHDEL